MLDHLRRLAPATADPTRAVAAVPSRYARAMPIRSAPMSVELDDERIQPPEADAMATRPRAVPSDVEQRARARTQASASPRPRAAHDAARVQFTIEAATGSVQGDPEAGRHRDDASPHDDASTRSSDVAPLATSSPRRAGAPGFAAGSTATARRSAAAARPERRDARLAMPVPAERPTINVTIDRIEVRPPLPAQSARAGARARTPATSLADYLRGAAKRRESA